MAHTWDRFRMEGRDFAGDPYDKDFLEAYLAYYFTVAVPQVQLVLLELLRLGQLPTKLCVLDIGVGSGTTAVATLDFLVALRHACDLHQVSYPISDFDLLGVDRNTVCLSCADRVVRAYQRALLEHAEAMQNAGRVEGSTRSVAEWADQVRWREFDLSNPQGSIGTEPNLVIASRVLGELNERARDHLDATYSVLPDGTVLAILEPGDKESARNLTGWRRQFLARRPDFTNLGPCGQEFGRTLPVQCGSCWMGRREGLHRTQLYAAFQEATSLDSEAVPQKFNDFENRLLSWTYVLLRKDKRQGLDSKALEAIQSNGSSELRFIGTYRNKSPVGYGPDGPDDLQASHTSHTWDEYLKICPATLGVSNCAILRPPGFEVPPLRFGSRVTPANMGTLEIRTGRLLYPLDDGTSSLFVAEREQYTTQFLSSYPETAQAAIDDLAFRLFGFEKLREFQHVIVGRVLQGKNVLGIAATGGGKSECFILPAMLMSGITIVVSPLRSLMTDQYEQRLKSRYGLHHLSTYINGELPFRERQARLRRMELGYYKLVYFTPEQLEQGWVLDFVSRAHASVGITYLAVDEAHCISQWGHDFRPSYLNIVQRLDAHGVHPVRIALTATASPQVRDDICTELNLDERPIHAGGDVFVYSSNRPEINLVVRLRENHEDKGHEIVRELAALERQNAGNPIPGAAIVFMPHTGPNPDEKSTYLPSNDGMQTSRQGVSSSGVTAFASYIERQLEERVSIYHGKMDDDPTAGSEKILAFEDVKSGELERVAMTGKPPGDLSGRTRRSEQEAFISGERHIMIATKGFGMGIDKPNVRLVIHRTPTANLESYAQEAGRAGRDGEPSTAILFHSPTSALASAPRDSALPLSQRHEQSDFEIQAFFISDRYIRREDVVVMRAFLKRVTRRLRLPGSDMPLLYVTNDEVIEFFDNCVVDPASAGLDRYAWPEFEPRRPQGQESEGHTEILDRGHAYEQRTRYVDRILAVLYRTRISNSPGAPPIGLVSGVQKTGARVHRLDTSKLNWKGIIQSNAYFGAVLRSREFDRNEFTQLLSRPSTIELAERLQLSVRDTATLLEDIKFSDGFADKSGKWRGALIDYWWLEAPYFGPAEGRGETLETWRDYAGARKRAKSPEARRRAKKAGRSHPSDDDWFGWSELPRRVGWQIAPGTALEFESTWDTFLECFMGVHDERERNDWASYHRLLTRYVGVGEDGRRVSNDDVPCLRATLLGYLKSGEIVAGGNCLSCSRCVPSERFTATLEERQSLIIRLAPEISDRLDEFEEKHRDTPPLLAVVDELLSRIAMEEAAGNSTAAYVGGWCDRLLDESPGHRAALWVRARSTTNDDPRLQKVAASELKDVISRIIHIALEDDRNLTDVWELTRTAHEVAPDEPDVLEGQAMLLQRLENNEKEEEKKWRQFLLLTDSAPDVERWVRAYSRLKELYGPSGALSNPERLSDCVLHLSNLTGDTQSAFDEYLRISDIWTWSRVISEIDRWDRFQPPQLSAIVGLVCAWTQADPDPNSPRFVQVADLFAGESEILGRLTSSEMRFFLKVFDMRVFQEYPDMLNRFATAALINFKPLKLKDALTWLAAFPRDTYALLKFETLVSVSREIADDWKTYGPITRNEANELVPGVANVMREMLLHPSATASTAQFVRGLLSTLPRDVTPAYVNLCARDPRTEAEAETIFSALRRRTKHYGVAKQCLEALSSPGNPIESSLLQQTTESFVLYKQFLSMVPDPIGKLNVESFDILQRVYEPSWSIDRADMLAETIAFLRRYLNPNWKTPVTREIEALCFARRFDEADKLVMLTPGLKIQGECADQYVNWMKKRSTRQRTKSMVSKFEPIGELFH
jgi:superfamily II DNA/RNA helicase